jgi:uncharacterized phiE125 gp8 family phage protein
VNELELTDTLISTVAGGSPAVQALTLAYAKQHIRALGTADDALTAVRIDAAASYFEEQTGRQLLTATREVWLDAFPFVGASGSAARIELPRPPLQSVVSVKYIDSAGVLQTFGGSPAVYRASIPVGDYARRGWVEPVSGQVWPIARCETGAVRIRYTCGYGSTAAAMPPLVRGILCFLIGHFDTFPSAVYEPTSRAVPIELPLGVKEMLAGFKYSAMPSQVLRTYGRWPTAQVWPWV